VDITSGSMGLGHRALVVSLATNVLYAVALMAHCPCAYRCGRQQSCTRHVVFELVIPVIGGTGFQIGSCNARAPISPLRYGRRPAHVATVLTQLPLFRWPCGSPLTP